MIASLEYGPNQSCIYILPKTYPGIAEEDPSILKVKIPLSFVKDINTQEVDLKDGMSLRYEDSSCNGYYFKLTIEKKDLPQNWKKILKDLSNSSILTIR